MVNVGEVTFFLISKPCAIPCVKVVLPATAKKVAQSINLTNELIDEITATNTEGVRIMIYVDDDVTIPLSVKAQYATGQTFEMTTFELKKGFNIVSAGFGSFVFKSQVTKFIMQFGTGKDSEGKPVGENEKTVYITQMYLYQK